MCCSCKLKLFRLEENGAPVTCQVSTGIALQACIILIHYYGWLVVNKEDPDWIFLQEGIPGLPGRLDYAGMLVHAYMHELIR